MSLQLLSEGLRSQLRSGVAITSLSQCVDELVLNGIDAGASSITVHVDISRLFIKATDNGKGITKSDLHLVGQRYVTSKCHTLSDLNELRCYGYRGEALASLSSICRQVEIISRHRFSNLTYYKSILHGQSFPPVVSSSHQLNRPGTTVILSGIFHSLPVRRKSIQSDAIELDKIKRSLIAISLIHPTISFSLYNNSNTKCLLQTQSTNSIPKTFSSLFGRELVSHLKQVQHSHMYFNIHGYISTESYHNKSLQFVYVNKRLVCKTAIHSQINTLLGHSLITNNRRISQHKTDTQTTTTTSMGMSPPQSDKYGVFILNIQCPLSEYDICIEPAKTLVAFKEWEGVLIAVDTTVKLFLKQYNLSLGTCIDRSNSHYLSRNSFSNNNSSFVSNNELMTIGIQSQSVKRSPLSLLSPSLSDNNTPMFTSTPFFDSGKRKSCSKIAEKLLKSKLQCLPNDYSTPLTINQSTAPSSIDQCTLPSLIDQCKLPSPIDPSIVSSPIDPSIVSSPIDPSIVSSHIDQSLDQPVVSLSTTTDHSNVTLSTEHHNETIQTIDLLPKDTQSYIDSTPPLSTTTSCTNKTTGWITTTDTITGSTLYINEATGNIQLTAPNTSTINTEETYSSCYGHQPLRAAPHLSYGYSPLCPRPKNERHSMCLSLNNTSNSSVNISMENEDISNKWRDDLSDWTNPAFSGGHQNILNIGTTSRRNSSQIKVHNMIHSHTFSPAMLTTVKVLGQVDNKFIACLLTSQLKGDLLVLFDQHAVHERIRLETLTEELYESNNITKRIQSIILELPLVIQMDRTSRELAITYTNQLDNIGVKCTCKGEQLYITSLPTVIMESCHGKELSSLKRLAHDLIVKHIEILKSVGIGTSIVPSIIQQILNSKACHGAIKFGDSLSLQKCSEMICSLSKCKLPFQCAHGRPSLIPILDLSLLEKRFPTQKPTAITTTNTKLNLSKLKYHN